MIKFRKTHVDYMIRIGKLTIWIRRTRPLIRKLGLISWRYNHPLDIYL